MKLSRIEESHRSEDYRFAKRSLRPVSYAYPGDWLTELRHLRRYLLPLVPSSRVEIHTTSRYSAVTGHTELAVFATRALALGVVLQELQGSVVPLPKAWREEMELGEGFAVEAAGEESDSAGEDENEVEDDDFVPVSREREKGKGIDRRLGARRSDRTKRRDFSIVWSGLKRCFQLFLGPARFLNVGDYC